MTVTAIASDDPSRSAAWLAALDWLADQIRNDLAADNRIGIASILVDLQSAYRSLDDGGMHRQAMWLAGRTARNLARPYADRAGCPTELKG